MICSDELCSNRDGSGPPEEGRVVTAHRNHILPLCFGSCSFGHVGEKSSCKQQHLANLRVGITHTLKINGQKRDFPPTSLYPQKKAGFLSSLPFRLSLTNKSAHVTSLLETLKWLPFALKKKKIQSPSHEWQGPP